MLGVAIDCPGEPFGMPRGDLFRNAMAWALALSFVSILAANPAISAVEDFGDVDAAIVMAADMSASVRPSTAYMQRQGHAGAIRSIEVAAAIDTGSLGCIAITYIEWSSVGSVHTVLPWTRLCSADDAARAADAILNSREAGSDRRGRTSIS